MSSMLINLKSLLPVLVMASSMFVLICNRFHAKRANSGTITFLGVKVKVKVVNLYSASRVHASNALGLVTN